jgi:hypothetical protein
VIRNSSLANEGNYLSSNAYNNNRFSYKSTVITSLGVYNRDKTNFSVPLMVSFGYSNTTANNIFKTKQIIFTGTIFPSIKITPRQGAAIGLPLASGNNINQDMFKTRSPIFDGTIFAAYRAVIFEGITIGIRALTGNNNNQNFFSYRSTKLTTIFRYFASNTVVVNSSTFANVGNYLSSNAYNNMRFVYRPVIFPGKILNPDKTKYDGKKMYSFFYSNTTANNIFKTKQIIFFDTIFPSIKITPIQGSTIGLPLVSGNNINLSVFKTRLPTPRTTIVATYGMTSGSPISPINTGGGGASVQQIWSTGT